jgi:hypothetical protein
MKKFILASAFLACLSSQVYAQSATSSAQAYSNATPGDTLAKPNFDLLVSTLTSAATSFTSADQINPNAKGVSCLINITAATGTTPTLVVTIQGKDVSSGLYYTLLASASIITAGQTRIVVYPGEATVTNVSVGDIIPHIWRISYTIGGTTPAFSGTVGCAVEN